LAVLELATECAVHSERRTFGAGINIKEGVTGMRNLLSFVSSVCVVACVASDASDEDSQATESSAERITVEVVALPGIIKNAA